MKVIKRVDPVVDFAMHIHCVHCESDLKIDASDLQYTASSGGNQRDYCAERFSVTCAVCQESISIEAAKIPPLVAKQARAKQSTRSTSSGPFDR